MTDASIPVSEESGEHKKWYDEARGVRSLDELVAFMKRVVDGYEHDYGTICHALSASALAAGNCANNMPGACGGITGFQAGFVMWGFITHWLGEYKDKPLRLVNYYEMLYPQYCYKFEKTISPGIWEYLQKEAAKLLSEKGGVETVRAHWQSIADGVVPWGYVVKEDK